MQSIYRLPTVIIELDGVSLSTAEVARLASVRVQQRLSLPTLCELTFVDAAIALTGIKDWRLGAALQVRVQGQPVLLFVGEVTALEYCDAPDRGKVLRIRGYDRLHRLHKSFTLQTYVQVTTPDLARELTAKLNIAVVAPNPGPLWQRLIQSQESDLDFLTTISHRAGLYFSLRQDELHLITLAGLGTALPLELGSTLLEARVEVNSNAVFRSITTVGWDPLRSETHTGSATAAEIGREVPLNLTPHQGGGSGERTLVNQAVQDDLQAEAIAQAELNARCAQEITLWGVAEGNPELRPGSRIQVRGLASTLCGQYVLATVNHLINPQQGFISEIATDPPLPQRSPQAATTSFGIVTQINDPDGLGRVQVTLPTHGDVETGWMEVLSAGAGANKGFVALPDVGDRVLALFPQGDLAQGVVLGSLYGTDSTCDWGIEAGAVKRYTLRTPNGQQVQLDDAARRIRLENQEGSYVELTPEGLTVHAETDLVIEAPGRSITIRGQLIDFENA
jgi:phage baseplate assembly protein V